jgi:hypothetical protein
MKLGESLYHNHNLAASKTGSETEIERRRKIDLAESRRTRYTPPPNIGLNALLILLNLSFLFGIRTIFRADAVFVVGFARVALRVVGFARIPFFVVGFARIPLLQKVKSGDIHYDGQNFHLPRPI